MMCAVPEVKNGQVTLWYAERGNPSGLPVVLMHGLFFSRRLFERLAERLPQHRMLLFDLRGHGRSSRPTDPASYTWQLLAEDVVVLLDRLEIDRAVVGGLSLGANVALSVATIAPHRLRGAIVEMPVLEGGQPAAERVFGTVGRLLRGAGSVMRPVARASRPLRRTRLPELGALGDFLSLEPVAMASMLEGLTADTETVLDGPASLGRAGVPTLVIAHRHDPIHPLDDARALINAVPDSELAVMFSQADLRLQPDRYAKIIGDFLKRLPVD